VVGEAGRRVVAWRGVSISAASSSSARSTVYPFHKTPLCGKKRFSLFIYPCIRLSFFCAVVCLLGIRRSFVRWESRGVGRGGERWMFSSDNVWVCNYIKKWEKEGVSGYSSSYLLGYQSNKCSFVLKDDCRLWSALLYLRL
jgi:hypothetical protein